MKTSLTIANRFELQDLLGRGGMGDVYRALDTQTGETVAVKALNLEILERDPSLLERFTREGEALRRLNHPNIVRMTAALEEGGRHYLVMEYVPGGSLQDLLSANRSLSYERVIQIGLDLADALTRAHRLGIIHRDLKPANVLLAEDGTPRLADFGIAHMQQGSNLTQTGVLMGTVDYLSPQLCQGEPPNELSDIWAFGVMLFEMLTGKLPFEGKNLTAKITAILNQPVPDLAQVAPNIPNALVDLIYRVLEKDPQQRIPSVRLVGAELEGLLKGRMRLTPSRITPAADAPKHNLPPQLSTFVGREKEIVQVKQKLTEYRLVTLTGAGGSGKTRLALQTAMNVLGDFKDGVWFVELAPLTDPALIPLSVAKIFGLREQAEFTVLDLLTDYLRARQLVLILDNTEHLVEACAQFVDGVLHSAPQVHLLVTSREALGIVGEHIFYVPSLQLPHQDSMSVESLAQIESVRLFVERAQAVQPKFGITSSNASTVAQICQRLDGIPLAIELAASRVQVLSVEQIAQRLDDAFRLLTSGNRTALPRQQTLRALIDWSYNLLSAPERLLFHRLSVFAGGWTLEAAEEICSDEDFPKTKVLEQLGHLVGKSLLTLDDQMQNGSPRYRMLETIRQYAREHLLSTRVDFEEVMYRHLEYFVKWSEEANLQLKSASQREWLGRMELESDNLRLALEWSETPECDPNIGLGLLSAVLWFWWLHGHYSEAKHWIERMLGRNCFKQSLAMAHVLSWAGIFLSGQSTQIKKAQAYLEDSLRIGRELEDKASISWALMMLARLAENQGDSVNAVVFGEQALQASRELGETWYICFALERLGEALRLAGDYNRAKSLYEESLGLAQRMGAQREIAVLLHNLGHVLLQQGSLEDAIARFWASLQLAKEIGEERRIIMCLEGMAGVFVQADKLEYAARVFGATAKLRGTLGADFEPADHVVYLRNIAILQRKELEAALAEGYAMTMEQAIGLVLKEADL